MRVFVLGAGASFHAGCPLAAEMGKRLAAWIDALPHDHQYRSCLDHIADVYGTLDDFETHPWRLDDLRRVESRVSWGGAALSARRS